MRALHRFHELFPGNRAFGAFEIGETKGEAALETVLEMVNQKGEFCRKLEEFYRSGGVPIGIIARLAASNPTEVWETFALWWEASKLDCIKSSNRQAQKLQ